MTKETLEANLSDLPPENQIDVLRSYPQLMKILVKRLGGKVEIHARELEQIHNYTLSMGMNPNTRTMQLTLTRPKAKEKMQ